MKAAGSAGGRATRSQFSPRIGLKKPQWSSALIPRGSTTSARAIPAALQFSERFAHVSCTLRVRPREVKLSPNRASLPRDSCLALRIIDPPARRSALFPQSLPASCTRRPGRDPPRVPPFTRPGSHLKIDPSACAAEPSPTHRPQHLLTSSRDFSCSVVSKR
jgi:hypothetical protein